MIDRERERIATEDLRISGAIYSWGILCIENGFSFFGKSEM